MLLKDLCARLPYGVIVKYKQKTLYPVGEYTVNVKADDDILQHRLKHLDFKPYLRPMSSMTEEEKKDLLNYVVGKDSKYFEICDDVSITDKSSDVQDVKSFELKWINFNPNTTSQYIEWLLKNHFDFCDLIQRGLALTAPDGMYKI